MHPRLVCSRLGAMGTGRLHRFCLDQHGRCSCAGKLHTLLNERASDGCSKTEAAATHPEQLGHELATNKSRVTVMKDGRPEVEPGMDAAQVADAITNEHYNRYVLGIDSLPKPQPQ